MPSSEAAPPDAATSPTTPPTGHMASDPRELRLHRDLPRRDVPFVPTDEPVVAAMLRFAGVNSTDVVYDLGCGDGRIVTAAAKHYGARGVRVDIDPLRITEARERARAARVGHLVQFYCESFFETDVREATVVMLYLLPRINAQLRPHLLRDLRPGTRIVANYFGMGEWQPDMHAEAHHRVLHQWIVPAWVEGAWKCVVNAPGKRHRMTLRLRRRYQVVTGTAKVGRLDLPISSGRLFGDQMTFKLFDPLTGKSRRFSCNVSSTTLRGHCEPEYGETATFGWGGVRPG